MGIKVADIVIALDNLLQSIIVSRRKTKLPLKLKFFLLLFLLVTIEAALYLVKQNQDNWHRAVSAQVVETNFEDPTYTATQKYAEKSTFTRTSITALSTPITHPLVIAVEKSTLAKYPNIETQIQNAVTDINDRMAAVGILRVWYIDHFSLSYDKNTSTGCLATNPEGKNLPTEFCSHPKTYVFIAADETTGSNYSRRENPSVEWHGYNGLLGSQGISVLGHELGHVLGLPDMYHVSISAANNFINSAEYKPFTGYIMHNLTPGNFHPWDAEIVNRGGTTLPIPWNTWTLYQPTTNILKIFGINKLPLPDAQVYVYTSDPSSTPGGKIDTLAEYNGTTNNSGDFSLGSNILGTNALLSLKAFLIKIVYNLQTEYYWLNITDVNFAHWQGHTTTAIYSIQTTLGLPASPAPSPTPPSSPVPTPTPPMVSPTPTPSPSYTLTDLQNLLFNFLTANDANYKPNEGKVNMLDAGWVRKWLD